MTGRRSYDDPCGVARGLNTVGERWALLIVRELLHGPKRFTDLHRGLPTASQNVLSARLHELERAGVVQRRRLGPPVGTRVYELTDWGYRLEPVIFHLARWGSLAPLSSGAELSIDSLMLALRTTFDQARAGDLRSSIELRLDDDRFDVNIDRGHIAVSRGAARKPDAIIETDVATFRELVFGDLRPASAKRSGRLNLGGDSKLAERFLGLFPRPTTADAQDRASR